MVVYAAHDSSAVTAVSAAARAGVRARVSQARKDATKAAAAAAAAAAGQRVPSQLLAVRYARLAAHATVWR